MKGQLFQIKNKEDEEIMLLWCSDPNISEAWIKQIIQEWWDIGGDDEESLIANLELRYEMEGITFERVYTEEIIV